MRALLRLSPLLLAVWSYSTPAHADAGNLLVTSYKINPELGPVVGPGNIPCNQYTADDINNDWGGDIVAGCDYDQVVVHWQGTLTVPVMTMLVVQHDDGAALLLNGDYWVDQWYDTGCQWDYVQIEPGTYDLDFWFYENGGDACAALWQSPLDAYEWAPVPPSWYGPSIPETTTTTTEPTTTTSTTTTTTTTSTTTTTEPTTTTSEAPKLTTTTITPTSTPTTTPLTTPGTEPLPLSTSTSTSTTTTTNPPTTTTSSTTTSTSSTTTTPAAIPPTTTPTTIAPTTSAPATEPDTAPISELSPAAIAETFSPEALEVLTDDQVAELVASINEETLTDEQAAVLSDAMTNAPENVKTEFENQINVFGGQFDSYIPVGSAVSVSVKRTIVAGAAAVLPGLIPARRNNG